MSAITKFAEQELRLTLTPAQAEMLSSFEDGNYSQAAWQCGRRGGKSLMSDVLALFDATMRDNLREMLRPGEPRTAAIIAPRMDQAEAHIANIATLLAASPRLSAMVTAQTNDSIEFSNRATIRAYPCSARSIRGGAWSLCVLDELAHMIDSESGNAAGDRVYEAALPSLAQFGDRGWLVGISTPLWKSGAFFKMVDRATSGRFGHIHYRHLSTAEMNPGIPAKWLAERQREDPDLYAREFLAEFVDGVSAYLTSTEVFACRREGMTLPPQSGYQYKGAIDPAYSHDSFALSIGHREAEMVVIDGVWTWRRHGHEATLDELTAVAKRYGVRELRTDQHSPVPIREGLAKRGLAADYKPWTNETKSDAFATLKVAINSATVELPNDGPLLEELCALEARPTPGGRTRIAASGSGHDDRAVVVAAVVDMLTDRQGDQVMVFFLGDGGDDEADWWGDDIRKQMEDDAA